MIRLSNVRWHRFLKKLFGQVVKAMQPCQTQAFYPCFSMEPLVGAQPQGDTTLWFVHLAYLFLGLHLIVQMHLALFFTLELRTDLLGPCSNLFLVLFFSLSSFLFSFWLFGVFFKIYFFIYIFKTQHKSFWLFQMFLLRILFFCGSNLLISTHY